MRTPPLGACTRLLMGCAVLLALWLAPHAPAHAAAGAVIRDLGAPGPDGLSAAFDVNQLGNIAGLSVRFGSSFDEQAVEWLLFRPVTLGKPPGSFAAALGISDNNFLSGFVDDRAARWQGTRLTLLPNLPGGVAAEGEDVNNSAVVVGDADDASDTERPVAWDAAGHIHDLGTLPGDASGEATRVNNRTQIVGCTGDAPHAVLWDHGAPVPLQGLPGQMGSCAQAINESGVIGGWVQDKFGDHVASLWQNGNIRPLLVIGLVESEVLGINNRNQAVGVASDVDDGNLIGVLWSGAQVIELDDILPPNSGWEFLVPHAINDQGLIVGYGLRSDGSLHGFAMTVS